MLVFLEKSLCHRYYGDILLPLVFETTFNLRLPRDNVMFDLYYIRKFYWLLKGCKIVFYSVSFVNHGKLVWSNEINLIEIIYFIFLDRQLDFKLLVQTCSTKNKQSTSFKKLNTVNIFCLVLNLSFWNKISKI